MTGQQARRRTRLILRFSRLESIPGDTPRHYVQLLAPPGPPTGGTAALPLSGEELQGLREWAGRAITRAQSRPAERERQLESDTVVELGSRLFQVLPIQVRRSLAESIAWAARRERRLEIGLDLSQLADSRASSDGPDLDELPWEWLWIPEAGGAGLLANAPFSRLVPRRQAGTAVSMSQDASSARVLLIESAAGTEQLPFDRALISQAASATAWSMDVCPAEIHAVQAALGSGRYQTVIFLGHGDFEPYSGEARLLFETEQGGRLALNASQLGALLSSLPDLRTVLLLACESGRGLARRLVAAGVPAVIAMQFPISDHAAASFVRSFLAALQAGVSPADATTAGRRAMRAAGFSLEWGTPVCYVPLYDEPKLAWTDLVEELGYRSLLGLRDLTSAAGARRLLKAAVLVGLQWLLWLPMRSYALTSPIEGPLALATGLGVIPLLLPLLSGRIDTALVVVEPGTRRFRLLQRYRITGAYLGYLFGLAVNVVLLALPLFYLRLGEHLGGPVKNAVWLLACVPPLLFAHTGQKRVALSVAAAYRELMWSWRDSLILLGVPLVVAPGMVLALSGSAELWLNRSLAPWIMVAAGLIALALVARQARRA